MKSPKIDCYATTTMMCCFLTLCLNLATCCKRTELTPPSTICTCRLTQTQKAISSGSISKSQTPESNRNTSLGSWTSPNKWHQSRKVVHPNLELCSSQLWAVHKNGRRLARLNYSFTAQTSHDARRMFWQRGLTRMMTKTTTAEAKHHNRTIKSLIILEQFRTNSLKRKRRTTICWNSKSSSNLTKILCILLIHSPTHTLKSRGTC